MSVTDNDHLISTLQKLSGLYIELSCKVIANEIVIAKLMKELSELSPEPERFSLRISAEITGIAERLAFANKHIPQDICDVAQISRDLHRICMMADC